MNRIAVLIVALAYALGADADVTFPGAAWETREPSEFGLAPAPLDELAQRLGGRGCVIKDGYVVKSWGNESEKGDWFSSAKPVLSTLLFFAIHEGLVKSVDQPIADWGWNLSAKDRTMTFRHLGSMTSGYARPEKPGVAWAYNDFAIQLYRKTLFDKVFATGGKEVAEAAHRLGALGLQDGLDFTSRHRLKASIRDFARICWFWLNRGRWHDRQVLPRRFFDEYMKPQTPKDMPNTVKADTDDYLQIGTYGGGSDHFTKYGAGIYGFNWWFNGTGRLHPDSMTWPDAPADTIMTIGARGNCSAMFPRLNMILVSAQGNWGELEGGKRDSPMNRILALTAKAAGYNSSAQTVSGDLAKWRPVTLDLRGPPANASDSNPNPFLDYRLQVQFTSRSGNTYDVPGFFAGDGKGGLSGDAWRVIFSPDEVGTWRYHLSFCSGDAVAVSLDRNAGEATDLDGATGCFEVTPQDAVAEGFYRWGRLEYVGEHYLKFRDGPYWLKGGTDSPEDFLAYDGFPSTPKGGHRYANHVADWCEDDPDWYGGKGKGIIGALNYLASQGVNSIYFLPMNIGGDGKNVHPYLGRINGAGSPDNDNLHLDLTRLHQWGVVFEHAQRKGIMLHFVLNEAEENNKLELDSGQLDVERKLYYRELIARFGHLPALQWNISEEYNLGHKLKPEMVKAFAQYIADVDPYDHPITVHHAGRAEKAWAPFLGDARFTVTSFQENEHVTELVEVWRAKSREAGVPLVIGMDEFFPDKSSPENIERHRREYLWPVYFSGGQIEFILDELLKVEDFRKYEHLWRYMAYARTFMMDHLPFWEMEPRDDLLTDESKYKGAYSVVSGQVFAKAGEVYAVYLPVAEHTGALDLSHTRAIFSFRWFDPRAGAFSGDETRVVGGNVIPLGAPPEDPSEDWVALLTREQSEP